MVIDLLRSQAALEAESLVLRQQALMLCRELKTVEALAQRGL